ncbi:Protein CBG20250 [Caenorhabditis briggsae]|uniref:Protein CBG20250 n=1 Tax=Caenorhabditis briggsae TaxID=6238 RepID=A8XXE4_CAEBR|nr:Protein CBG20250 [Caenorhabditis briggsae]CAP37333.2 Protein CBG20250 [Caenorhabditis briggsae]
MLFGLLIFMFTLSWKLSMITLINIPIIFLVNKIFGVWYDIHGFLNVTLKIATRKVFVVIGLIWSKELLQMGILTIVLWYGGHLVIDGKVESGLLVSFLLYQFQLGENLRVQEAISKNLKGKTVILIAHRLSTVENWRRWFG